MRMTRGASVFAPVSLAISRNIAFLLSCGHLFRLSRAIGMVWFALSSPVDNDGAEIVDVGEGRPRDDEQGQVGDDDATGC
jgi:hypothetical protein